MSPVPIQGARVLELGCGSGGNLILLAAQMPGAMFTGIDIADAQVRLAGTRIAALAVKNISIAQADLKNLDLGNEQSGAHTPVQACSSLPVDTILGRIDVGRPRNAGDRSSHAQDIAGAHWQGRSRSFRRAAQGAT